MSSLQKDDSFLAMLGKHEIEILKAQLDMVEGNVIERLWQKDFTLWSDSPNEISNRLDWLEITKQMENEIESINSFVKEIIDDGYKSVLLLGMGGSSLAPEVFRLTFGAKTKYLDLEICDSTHPDFIKSKMEKFEPANTLYLVSTKSGGTIETISFMKHFFNFVADKIGLSEAKKHFVAITDPGSGLQEMAIKLGFRKIFLNNPNIGGRFSALSLFGLVPAALIGINLSSLLERANKMVEECRYSNIENIKFNSAANLGLIIGYLANKGIDKLTLNMSQQVKPFGSWAEQLIAESTGKIGKGILPIDGEELIEAELYSKDRIFVFITLKGDNTFDEKIIELSNKNFPVIKIILNDVYELGAEFFRWEFATAVAGWLMKLQPFDQPNVESAKVVARSLISEYKVKGNLPLIEPSLKEGDIEFVGNTDKETLKECLLNFIEKNLVDGSYITIQAFINPIKEAEVELQKLRAALLKKYKVATTLGFGPRFLHSTGQLHKGDSGKGLFIQFVSDVEHDISIPEDAGKNNSTFTFGVLITAQAFGDRKALQDNNRNVITIKINENISLITKFFE